MHVLQVSPYFAPAYAFGGPVKVCYEISRELVKMGHSVTVYTSDANSLTSRMKAGNREIDGINVYYFRNLSLFLAKSSNLFITPELFKKVASDIDSFDVIHLHEYTTIQNVVIHRFAKKRKVPYIFQAHGTLPKIGRVARQRLFDIFFGRRLLRDTSRVVALNRWEAGQYVEAGVSKEKVVIIPSGIDLSEYVRLPAKGTFRRKFGISNEVRIVLFLGRINWIKGVDVLVEAFADVAMKLETVKLVIVGPDEGYLRKLRALISALHIEEKVLIIGPLYLKDKVEAYVDANVYVLPSRYETFPVGLLEAYACGKPVIGSKVGGLKDLVINGVTGLLVEPEDRKQLADSILSLLNDDHRAEEMGLEGSLFVRENFGIEKSAQKLEQLYDKVAGISQ